MNTIPSIPVRYKRFPSGYINDVRGWGFNQQIISEEEGRLLTLDLDFGSYCSLGCPACFQSDSTFKRDTSPKMSFDEMKQLVLDAKELGLRTVKFLGEGEPLQSVLFVSFLRFLHSEGIVPLIFTHGHVIGDDEEVARWNKIHGITTGEQLTQELYRLGASIVLGFNSFDDDVQGNMVGRDVGFVKIRNRALTLLVDAGFTREVPTRLALAVNPVGRQNVSDAFAIYKWARLRNMYAVVTPSMISGKGRQNWKESNPTNNELFALYTKIYSFNIETGLQTMDQIRDEGISSYAGGHPCNQVATGLYIKQDGGVWSCPGSDSAAFMEGSLQKGDLSTIWNQSENRKRAGVFNNRCIAKDGKSIPRDLYKSVLHKLELKFSSSRRIEIPASAHP